MGWQAIDERGYWDGLTNGNVVTRAAGVICPMARLLLADGTDASPDTGEWAAVVPHVSVYSAVAQAAELPHRAR